MGADGVLGSQLVRERGGRVYIQDEASSVVWGMPGQVAAAGAAIWSPATSNLKLAILPTLARFRSRR
jgi:chemotaxis response regulator CheB